MPIVTLTTDLGWEDYYVGAIKGAILCESPDVHFVDITHSISPHDIVQGAFTLKNAYPNFPKGTIHLININNSSTDKVDLLLIQHDGHYFLGPDNGVFSLLFNEQPLDIRRLPGAFRNSFSIKELLGVGVGYLVHGKAWETIGDPGETIRAALSLQPVIGPNWIRGSVIYIDHYENAVVNITKDLWEKVGQQRKFELLFKRHEPIELLAENYFSVPVGAPLCLFNAAGYLEIAVNMGKARSLLGLEMEDTVQVDFKGK